MELSRTLFWKNLYAEAALSTRWLRLGVSVKHHPSVVMVVVGLAVASVTVGVTRDPRR
jgi:hypothetical protein